MGGDSEDQTSAILAAFKEADQNGDGLISREELKRVFGHLEDWSDEDFDTLFDAAETTGDGKLNYEEFVQWIMGDQNEGGKVLMKSLPELLGEKLLCKVGEEVNTAEALAGKVVGIYFSAHWCPPCRQFTPLLVEAYNSTLKEKGFEVVFVSADNSDESFEEYYGSMPWLAMKREAPEKENLSMRFKSRGIPTLLVFDTDGTLLTREGRAMVGSNLDGFPWKPDPELRAKCDELFDIYDADANGFLDWKELNSLALDTGGHPLPMEIWPLMCMGMELDPNKGLDKGALFKAYTEQGKGSIEKDLATAKDPVKRKKGQIMSAAMESSRLSPEQLNTIFEKYDSEKELSKEEFEAMWKELGFQEEYLGTYFDAIDTNKNGVISFKELLAGLTVCSGTDADATAELLMQVYDTKKTGYLDKEEFVNAMTASLKVMQASMLTALQPMMEMMAQMAELAKASGECEGEMPPMPTMDDLAKEAMGSMPSTEELASTFDQIDPNTDGKLELDELKEVLKMNPEMQRMMLPNKAAKQLVSAVGAPTDCMVM